LVAILDWLSYEGIGTHMWAIDTAQCFQTFETTFDNFLALIQPWHAIRIAGFVYIYTTCKSGIHHARAAFSTSPGFTTSPITYFQQHHIRQAILVVRCVRRHITSRAQSAINSSPSVRALPTSRMSHVDHDMTQPAV
jgi:hypothetical protein